MNQIVKYLVIILGVTSSVFATVEVNKDTLAKVKHDYKNVYFRENVQPTVNKKIYFVTIPKQFKGYKVTRLESVNELTDELTFTVKSEGNVLLIAQHTTVDTLKKDGWIVVDEFEINHDRFKDASVLMKHLEEGDYKIQSIVWMGTRLIWK